MSQSIGIHKRNRNDRGKWIDKGYLIVLENWYKTERLTEFCNNNTVGEWSFRSWSAGVATFEFEKIEDATLFKFTFLR